MAPITVTERAQAHTQALRDLRAVESNPRNGCEALGHARDLMNTATNVANSEAARAALAELHDLATEASR